VITTLSEVPAHVLPELVWDHSFAAFLEDAEDPFVGCDRFRGGPPIIWATDASYGCPAWILTRHDVIEEAFANAGLFSSKRGALIGATLDPSWMMLPVEADPPEHADYRKILIPFFTPAAIGRRLEEVEGLCNRLIDAFIDKGTCNFITEFAEILPNAIVVSMMGMPQEMLRQFLDWEEEIMRGATNEIRIAANNAIIDYLKVLISEQRENPTSEMIKAVINGQIKDRPLNDGEILGIVYLLYAAGLDTVFASLGWIMRHLATDQALQTRLRDNPGEIKFAVEEFTRAFGVSSPPRIVAEDMVYRGVPMKKGDSVILPTFLAGRDPAAWPSPHTIDIDRKPRHATFGVGPHICLGIHLAKREMRIMIETFLTRMRNIRIAPGESFAFHATSTVGVDRLILEWDMPS
jgi:cytochrome P450